MFYPVRKWLSKFLGKNKKVASYLYPNTTHVSPNFTYREVLPPNVEWGELSLEARQNLRLAVNLAESVRAETGLPCDINTYHYGGNLKLRGFRFEYQQSQLLRQGLTTVKHSRHMDGKALDMSCKGIDLYEFAEIARKYFNTVIVYPKKNFIHVDIDKRGGKKYYGIL